MAKQRNPQEDVSAGAVPPQYLEQPFPPVDLPIAPPFPPMEAKLVAEIPSGEGWLYEPKWDGFRCLAFRSGDEVLLQSKAGQPLGRYFPEMVEALRKLPGQRFVLDGEIAILREGRLSFDDLLMRIHPAESRIRKLSRETPATYLVFDLLVDDHGHALQEQPLWQRRKLLEAFFRKLPKGGMVRLSPVSLDRAQAQRWMTELGVSGFDGVVAKKLDASYASGERSAMHKVKRMRTADCVVGGFRWAQKGGEVGSLLLGLYGDDGLLHHVGFTSSFKAEQRKELKSVLRPLVGGAGFTGNAPGGPSRWSTERSGQWERLDPKLVCEVQFDHFSGGRFRHGTKFLRWRPEKAPKQCTFEQVEARGTGGLVELGLAS
jgi:ATP-dependent DNA ligase